jgi:S-adenosylmethionine-diacylgycerolhomoserine-N-methlytransferase
MEPHPQSHAELMDSVYRYQRYIYDFTRKYYLFGRDRLIRDMALGRDETVLEVGCGTARNLIAMARRYPGARLYGLDASHEMLKTAQKHVAKAGLSHRIILRHGYAEDLTPALFARSEPFDRIVFSYSLSMIPDWYQGLNASRAALDPGGRLHVVDFGDLTGLGPAGARLMRTWLKLFHVEPRVEILRALELAIGKTGRNDRRLSILPGRYAFVLSCLGAELPPLAP